MRWGSRLATTMLVLGLPSVALACGTCTDMMLRNAAWWGTWPYWVLPALLVDATLFALYARVRRLPPPARPWKWTALLAVPALAILAVGFVGTLLAFGAVVPALLPGTVRSVRRLSGVSARERRLVLGARGVLLVGFLAAFVGTSVPSQVPADRLLQNVTYWELRLEPPGWGVRELARRREQPAVNQALATELQSQGLTTRAGRLLRLHHFLEGPPEQRQAGCERWRKEGTGASLEAVCAGVR